MRRIRLTIAYDGTAYCGFQLQPEGMPTVEGELNRALTELTGEEITVIGASRTDSGVHAYGNVAVFDTEASIPADRYPYALQAKLPQDIRVIRSDEVPYDWHPRKTDCVKTYEYTYSCGPVEDPGMRLYSAYSRRVPDVERMKQAAASLIGTHDFTSFANPSSQQLKEGRSAVRTIYGIDISVEPPRKLLHERLLRAHEESAGDGGAVVDRTVSNVAEDSSGLDYRAVPYVAEVSSKPAACADKDSSDGACVGNTTVRIRVSGSGFLYNMVRIIAGTLMNVGCGLWEPERVRDALNALDRRAAGPTAEARGLTLLYIDYSL